MDSAELVRLLQLFFGPVSTENGGYKLARVDSLRVWGDDEDGVGVVCTRLNVLPRRINCLLYVFSQ